MPKGFPHKLGLNEFQNMLWVHWKKNENRVISVSLKTSRLQLKHLKNWTMAC